MPPAEPSRRAAARRCFSIFDNASLTWEFSQDVSQGRPHGMMSAYRWGTRGIWDFLGVDLAGCGVTGQADEGVYRPLFDALNDPQRFALAHVLLVCASTGDPPEDHEILHWEGRRVETFLCRLRIELPPAGRGWDHDPVNANAAAQYYGPAAGYDPAQIPELRDFWFNKLAVPVGSVPWSALTAASALFPLLWLALRVRFLTVMGRRRRRGMCLRCGYDLAGNTSGRCSECGAATRTEKRSASV
jgi:hypothetical protein